MDDVHLKNHVVVHKVRKMTLVGNDTTYFGGSQEDVLGFLGRKERFYRLLTAEIKLFMRTSDDVRIALTLQFAHDRTSHHAAVTGYVYL